ncbi:N-acetylated-alpha-linked acidic dipeptidase [Chitinophaga sp. CF118]|uniref:transferrin receptor-like dimerization domain-containing protein n=1 Tax=Chitinophaga sp. CF118 TaxID=1884367 RepID=UPI0008EE1C99|nr:transferrin receptor-like dimerization domain-containing protein [Chitinophaga sp. CF118]SFD56371.1 N-acetylated-alpha-linked acidic dipeptidase [Chitinophaga sp. CF118]
MQIRSIISVVSVILSCTTVAAQQKSISGFKGDAITTQQQLEARFDQLISSANIGETIRELSAKPHHVGSANGKAVAESILAKFKSYGWDAHLVTYQVLFPTPKTRMLELTGATPYKALLKEPALKEDATSGQEGQLPTYNAWSADGNVTAALVYVNFGLPEDYEWLERAGIDVKGKIVIARYGHSWRGTKPKVAQEHGAIGCIIYSDPAQDGYVQGDVYPKGAYKNEYGVQRGSIMDMVIYPGDPLTPGIGATQNAKRLDRLQAPNLLKIPVLPISYHDAQPLLAALTGPVVPAAWRGGLPITYHAGPGKEKVHLEVSFDWQLRSAYDVIAEIKGAQFPDQWIIRGNHHDAWVNGAADPVSGLAAELEEAKAIGELVKGGYKPARTLVYCAWDAEEPGLIGSTEWVEDHAEELQKKTVAYINTDNNGRGFLFAGGSHALEPMMGEIAKDVVDPQTHVSIFERKRAFDAVNANGVKAKKEALQKQDLKLEALGSGSDYSSFLQHLGIPSLNLGFGGEDDGGEYHSIYDSYDDFSRFKDPGFVYGTALAQTAGRAVLRLADASVLPFDFRSLHKTISTYVDELQALTTDMRETTKANNLLINTRQYSLAANKEENLKLPVVEDEVPYIDFSPLQNALLALDNAAQQLAGIKNSSPAINEALYQAEQQLLAADGLPRRSWYKHTIYAPGFYTGYGVKTIPGVREAIEQRNWKEAQVQIGAAAAAINRLAVYLAAIR